MAATEATALLGSKGSAPQSLGHGLPLVAAVLVAASAGSAAGLWVFLGSAFVRTGGPTPASPRSYGAGELQGLTLFVFASPVAVAAAMGALLLLRKQPGAAYWAGPGPAALLALLAAAACAVLGVWQLEGREMLACGFLWCYAAPPSGADPSGFKASAGAGVAALAAAALSLAAVLLWRDWGAAAEGGAGRLLAGEGPSANSLAALQNRQAWKRRASALAVLAALPLMVVLCGTLPNTWERFSRNPSGGPFHSLKYFMSATGGCDGVMKSEKPGAGMVTLNWRWSDNVVVKLFPDTLLFYGFLEGVVLVSALAAEFPESLGRLLSRKLGPSRAGMWLLGTWFAAFLALYVRYWAVHHLYHADGKFNDFGLEVAARTCGVTAVMLLGLLLLPAAKSSPVLAAAGLSWESSVWVHIILGVLFLLAACGHVALYFARFLEMGYPRDILPFHAGFSYPQNPIGGLTPSDNWAVPLMSAVFWPSLLCFGVFPWLRRWSYELFRHTHYMSVVLVPALLWHATNAWYFILPGMVLWTIDRVLRLLGACEVVRLQGLQALSADCWTSAGPGQPPRPAPELITKVSFKWPGQARVHSPGMYVLVNLPQLSLHEWHPFSLSSAPSDASATLHVKSMGEGTFTGRLHDLAKGSPSGGAIVMNVQGPYGPQASLADTPRALLIAGGIGITPMCSALRCAARQGRAGQHGRLRRLRLVWVVRSAAVADLLAEELSEDVQGLPFELELSVFCSTTLSEEAPSTCRLGRVHPGKPDFRALLTEEAVGGSPLLVRACGPPQMVKACQEEADAAPHGLIDFEPWSFVL